MFYENYSPSNPTQMSAYYKPLPTCLHACDNNFKIVIFVCGISWGILSSACQRLYFRSDDFNPSNDCVNCYYTLQREVIA